MLDGFVKLIVKLSNIIAITMMAALTVMVMLQVVFRALFNNSLSWSTEMAAFMLAWITLFAAVPALYEGKHLAIDFVGTRLKSPWDKITRILANFIVLMFVLSLIYYGIPMVIGTLEVYAVSLPISKGIIYSVLPITAFLMVFIIVNDISKDLNLLLKETRTGV